MKKGIVIVCIILLIGIMGFSSYVYFTQKPSNPEPADQAGEDKPIEVVNDITLTCTSDHTEVGLKETSRMVLTFDKNTKMIKKSNAIMNSICDDSKTCDDIYNLSSLISSSSLNMDGIDYNIEKVSDTQVRIYQNVDFELFKEQNNETGNITIFDSKRLLDDIKTDLENTGYVCE